MHTGNGNGGYMKKIVIIPDSFKGTISSRDAGRIIEEEARLCFQDAEIVRAEAADGGEGSVDAFLSVLPGRKKKVCVSGPYGDTVESFYGITEKTAIIEMAAAAGLPLAGERLETGKATTFGVGELIKDALEEGAEQIILGLGGSVTSDGGTGAAVALGVKFYDAEGKEFIPVGNTLSDISAVNVSGLHRRLGEVKIIAMCDIENTLCGEYGAAAVFGPQKGAKKEDIAKLDKGLFHLAGKIKEALGVDVLELKGGAAAGGMGAGAAAFFGAELGSGIDVVLETIRFEEMLTGCSMVITGEGKLDGQSAQGKVIAGVARRAKKRGIPVLVLAGAVTDDADTIYEAGVTAAFGINRLALPFEELKERTSRDLRNTARSIFRLLCAADSMK